MPERIVKFRSLTFKVNTEGDHYGDLFWDSLQNLEWEPDTLDFLFRTLSSQTIFFDIGAANGSMSLIAAKLGARVIGYEPNPTVASVLNKNIELNNDVSNKIDIKMAAVSSKTGLMNFAIGADPSVISDISVGDHENTTINIPILNLKDEVLAYRSEDKKFIPPGLSQFFG